MLIEWFLSIKSLPNLLFGVLCLPGDQSHPVAQPTINPLACCICWARLLGRAVFPPWNKGPNSGSYIPISSKDCYILNKYNSCVQTDGGSHFLKCWIETNSESISTFTGEKWSVLRVCVCIYKANHVLHFCISQSGKWWASKMTWEASSPHI